MDASLYCSSSLHFPQPPSSLISGSAGKSQKLSLPSVTRLALHALGLPKEQAKRRVRVLIISTWWVKSGLIQVTPRILNSSTARLGFGIHGAVGVGQCNRSVLFLSTREFFPARIFPMAYQKHLLGIYHPMSSRDKGCISFPSGVTIIKHFLTGAI